MRKIAFLSYMALLSAFVCPAFPNALITTPKYKQDSTNWCWIATTKMTLDYYNKNTPLKTQREICAYAVGAISNVPGYLTSGGSIFQAPVDRILTYFKSLSSTWDPGVLSMKDFAAAILKGRPIFIGETYGKTPTGHVVLAVGFDTKDGTNNNIGPLPQNEITNVFYNDPGDGKTGQKSFALMRKNQVWTWDETLRLATDGPSSSVGINDKVSIDNFTYQYVYPFTSKTAFSKFYSNVVPADHCYSFSWSIAFQHTSDKYTAQSGTVTGTDQSTWTISPFNLPGGYSWIYHPTGAVSGSLSVECTDNKGFPHSDTKSVLFFPSNYYPVDVLYENKTTSTTQSEVKAHNWIGISNANLNSGTMINFRAGSSMSVFDGTTIGNGAIVNFTIEPALK